MRQLKDSGIEWIGEIPEHWDTCHFNRLHEGTNVGESIDKQYWNQDNGDIIFYTAGLNPIRTNYPSFPIEKFTKWNDLLLARNGTPYIYRPSINAAYTDHVIRVSIKPMCDKLFLQYALSMSIRNEVVDTVSIATWSASIWNAQIIPLPPLSEQQRIASYLDAKCANIDALVSLQQTMIEKLQTYKQSVITEAVTKGLDKTVKMKDSGIEWIGEIPEEWKIKLLSSIFYEHKCKNSNLKEKNLLSLSYGKIIRKNINSSDGLLPHSFNNYNVISANDIVFRLTDLQNDKRSLRTGLCKERGIITSAYVTIRGRNMVNTPYYHYLMYSYDICKVFYGLGDGVRQGMNYNDLRKIPILSPLLIEQQRIASYLDAKCANIDALIATKQKKIEKLNAYKQSLIYECVTGKKEL